MSGFAHEPAYDEPHHVPEGSPSGPAEEVLSGVAVKVLVKAPGIDPETLRDVVAAAVGDTRHTDLVGRRAGRDQCRRRDQGGRAGPGL